MNVKIWYLILTILMVVSIGLIIACETDDDEDDDDEDGGGDTDDDDDSTASCTLNDICTLVYDKCPDHDGLASIEECENVWFTYCGEEIDQAGYMDCVCACYNADDTCDDFFNNCELSCWAQYCPEA